MRRRQFIAIAGSVTAWPLAAHAQQSTMPTLGLLGVEADSAYVVGIQQGLKESGYVAGQNIAIEYHWAEGRTDRLPALATDLVHRQVTVIVAYGTPAVAAAKAATATIPIVFDTGADPIASGFVCQPQSTGRQSHGHNNRACGDRAKTIRTIA